MKNVFLFTILLISTSLFWSCDKDEPDPPDTIDSFDDGVIITCEGGFGLGNATVYFLDPEKMAYVPEIYNAVNKEPIGDVLQSIVIENDKAYLVVNNSGKILEVNEKTFRKSGAIEGLSAPTEMDIEDGKGYIGSLYSRHILVANMNSLQVEDSIYLGEQSNRVYEDDDRLWVLSQSEYQGRIKDHIYFINLSDNSVDSVKVGSNPSDWALSDNDEVFVYCQGSESTDGPAIYTIDMDNPDPAQKVEVNAPSGFLSKVAYDEKENRVLVQLEDGIYTYNQGDASVSSTALIGLSEVVFLYALDVSPDNGDIYIGDAKDFSSAGLVYIYSGNGQPKTMFQVGVGPNHFYFD